MHATTLGEHLEMPPELTEEEALQVAVILSGEEEKRLYPQHQGRHGVVNGVALPPPPG
jgi:hypothetical protein